MKLTTEQKAFIAQIRKLKKEGAMNFHFTCWDGDLVIKNNVYPDWILFTPSGAISSITRDIVMTGTRQIVCKWKGASALPTTVAK